MLMPFRFGERFFWASDEYSEFLDLELEFANRPTPTSDEIKFIKTSLRPSALASDPFYIARQDARMRWPNILRAMAKSALQMVYWRWRGYEKGRFGPLLGSQLVNLTRARRNMDYLNKHAVRDLDAFRDAKLVYFPLQQEPESSTLAMAPYTADQFALVREMALSLPADYQLAVKEHRWALYGRTRDFYERIRAMPNVVLIHPLAESLRLIDMADMTAAITSSAAYEAAILGKPTIHFGFRSSLFVLQHVYNLQSGLEFERLRTILSEANAPGAAERRRADGARYFLAAKSVCLDLDAFAIHGRKQTITEEEAACLCEPMLRGLRADFPWGTAPSLGARAK
jgi:hypothetical protein